MPSFRKLASGEYRLYLRKINPKTGKRRNLGTFKTIGKAKEHERGPILQAQWLTGCRRAESETISHRLEVKFALDFADGRVVDGAFLSQANDFPALRVIEFVTDPPRGSGRPGLHGG